MQNQDKLDLELIKMESCMDVLERFLLASNQIQENAAAMLEEVKKLKPATAKGVIYSKRCFE